MKIKCIVNSNYIKETIKGEKMIRQIFIAPVREDVPEEKIQERIQEQLKLKEHVAGIEKIVVNKALGLYGMDNAVVMTIDLKDMDAWEELLANKFHTKLGNEAENYFDVNGFVVDQVEI